MMIMQSRKGAEAAAVVVAQVSNRLYRMASSLQVFRLLVRVQTVMGLPIGNRRYSRLVTCATTIVSLRLCVKNFDRSSTAKK